MENETYITLFQAFEKAPMRDFLEMLLRPLDDGLRRKLILEDVSYHRYGADQVTLEAWMCVVPVESNQWIWARVEMNGADGTIEEQFFTKDNYRQQALGSLADCIKNYKKDDEE